MLHPPGPGSRRLQPHQQAALAHRDRRRDGAHSTHGGLGGECHVDVVRCRQPVGDERRLEGNDGCASFERVDDIGGDPQHRARVPGLHVGSGCGHRGLAYPAPRPLRCADVRPPRPQRRAPPASLPRVSGARPLLPVTPEIVDAQVVLEELDLAPDGHTAVIVRRRTRGLDYRRDLLLVDLDGGPPRPLQVPLKDPTHPRFSPDGTADRVHGHRHGCRARAGATGPRPAAHPIASRAGRVGTTVARPRLVTRETHGVSGFAWSPDSTRIAFWGWAGPARFVEGANASRSAPDGAAHPPGVVPLERGRLPRSLDAHLGRRAAARGTCRAPDQRRLRRHRTELGRQWPIDRVHGRHGPGGRPLPRDTGLSRQRRRRTPWRMGRRGQAQAPVEVLRLGDGTADAATPSPDGRWLAVSGSIEPGAPDWSWPHIFLARVDGSGTPIRLGPESTCRTVRGSTAT